VEFGEAIGGTEPASIAAEYLSGVAVAGAGWDDFVCACFAGDGVYI